MTRCVRSVHGSTSQAFRHTHWRWKEGDGLQSEWENLAFLQCMCVHWCLPQKVGHSLVESSRRKWCLTMTQPSHALQSSSLQSACVLLPLSLCCCFYILFILLYYHSFLFMCFRLGSLHFCPSPPDSSWPFRSISVCVCVVCFCE